MSIDINEFRQGVYDIVAEIPKGKVMTYGQIATLLGWPDHARLVGHTLHGAPLSLHLPCHRVVNAQGRPAPGWIEQRKLLADESVIFKGNGHVDLTRFQWHYMEELNITMMRYKMIVLDLDGTLTNEKKEITPKTKDALMRAQRLGVKIVLASGRPTYGITALAEELELATHDGYILAFNGGKVTNCANGEVVFEQKLEGNLVPTLYDAAMQAGMEILTYQGNSIAATKKENKYVLHEAFINKMPVVQYDRFLEQIVFPINKCLIVGDPVPLHQLEQRLVNELKGKMEIYRSAGFFLECVPLGIDKARSLDRLINMLGIRKEEIIACGDGYNDQSMIRFAGLGVAMANASKDVQDTADYITYSNEQDGVAHVVEKFIL